MTPKPKATISSNTSFFQDENSTLSPTGILNEDEYNINVKSKKVPVETENHKIVLVWRNIAIFSYLHAAALYGIYLMLTATKFPTNYYVFIIGYIGGLGITAGAHRLWTHKAYKAKLPLQIFLMILNTFAFQDCVIHWSRDHRVHHKYSETNADPHNATRGFFFSHMGWLLCRKHPDVKEKGGKVDISDLEANPILAFQKKYYMTLMPLICFIIPTIIPVYFWGETWVNAWHAVVFRYIVTLHGTWLINSAAHVKSWGFRPYDKDIYPAENIVTSLIALGEGWHNYHHTFPWDYKAAELGNYFKGNFTTFFIDVCAKLGLAYDLKTASQDMIQKRVERTGDGTHEIWGWGDQDQSPEERNNAIRLKPKNI